MQEPDKTALMWCKIADWVIYGMYAVVFIIFFPIAILLVIAGFLGQPPKR